MHLWCPLVFMKFFFESSPSLFFGKNMLVVRTSRVSIRFILKLFAVGSVSFPKARRFLGKVGRI